MSRIVGYMVTWTTYGSWLPGDERGYVKDGQILPGNLKVLERNKKRQKSPTVRLSAREKQIVHRVILAEAQKAGHQIEACVVFSNHVHLAARAHSKSIEEVAGRYKSMTTRALWQHGRNLLSSQSLTTDRSDCSCHIRDEGAKEKAERFHTRPISKFWSFNYELKTQN